MNLARKTHGYLFRQNRWLGAFCVFALLVSLVAAVISLDPILMAGFMVSLTFFIVFPSQTEADICRVSEQFRRFSFLGIRLVSALALPYLSATTTPAPPPPRSAVLA
jgi:hypothetical protein